MSGYKPGKLRLSCAAGVIILAGMAQSAAYAVQCGDVITENTVLKADVGPCVGAGLIIGRAGITLDLGGHRVTGNGTDIGVLVRVADIDGGATIQGPGQITNFTWGIAFSQVNNVAMKHLTLEGNTIQIGIFQSSGDVVSENNLQDGGIGIHLSESTNVTIQDNRITGNTGPGIEGAFTGLLTITDNTISGNQAGIAGFMMPGFMTIQGNTVSNNQGDGIVVTSCKMVAGNHVERNGGSGIVTRGGPGAAACPIHENTAMLNGVYGIAVVGSSGFQVTDNHAMQNGVDLFWDGTGVGNCWSGNLFKTSQPGTLPACQ